MTKKKRKLNFDDHGRYLNERLRRTPRSNRSKGKQQFFGAAPKRRVRPSRTSSNVLSDRDDTIADRKEKQGLITDAAKKHNVSPQALARALDAGFDPNSTIKPPAKAKQHLKREVYAKAKKLAAVKRQTAPSRSVSTGSSSINLWYVVLAVLACFSVLLLASL